MKLIIPSIIAVHKAILEKINLYKFEFLTYVTISRNNLGVTFIVKPVRNSSRYLITCTDL